MAKRAQLTTEDVLDTLDDSLDLSDCEDWEGLDGIREPITAGSDAEFSDLEDHLEEEEEEYVERLEVHVSSEATQHEGIGETTDMHVQVEEHDMEDSVEDSIGELPSISLRPRDGNVWSPPTTPPPTHSFTAEIGPTTAIPDNPLAAFLLTFTPSLIASIVREYAQDVMTEERFSTWEPITENKLRAYLGFSILMAIAHVPALDDYWKRDPLLSSLSLSSSPSSNSSRLISRTMWN